MSPRGIVFWQDALSIHQAPLIREVARLTGATVYVVVESSGVGARSSLGWSRPDYGSAIVIEGVDSHQAQKLSLDIGLGAANVVTGLGAYPAIKSASAELLRRDATVLFQSEGWDDRGFKGWGRAHRYHHRRYMLNSHKGAALLAMGSAGVEKFVRAGFDPLRVHEFGYFTELGTREDTSGKRNGAIYVGSLSARKNVSEVIRAHYLSERSERLTIIGTGPLEYSLKGHVATDQIVEFKGMVNHQDVPTVVEQHEVLVLASLFDGWGAVVNEALSVGTPVICSRSAGAAALLERGTVFRGGVYEAGDVASLAKKFDEIAVLSEKCPGLHQAVREWAEETIAPEVGANYLLELIEYVYSGGSGKSNAPRAPWS